MNLSVQCRNAPRHSRLKQVIVDCAAHAFKHFEEELTLVAISTTRDGRLHAASVIASSIHGPRIATNARDEQPMAAVREAIQSATDILHRRRGKRRSFRRAA